MLYDVAIIGAGATGAATAYMLSQYAVNTVLLESGHEVCSGVSKANSGIVHGGFHHPSDSLKTRLELRGNELIEKLFVLGFERIGERMRFFVKGDGNDKD